MHCKMPVTHVAFCHFEEDAAFRERTRDKNVEIYYLNEQNAAQTMRVNHRKHGLRLDPSTAKAVRNLIDIFEKVVAHAIDLDLDDLPLLWKLLQKFIRRKAQFVPQVHKVFHVF